MDIKEALDIWHKLGHTTHDYYDEHLNYIILFLKHGIPVGKVTAIPGQGLEWELPDDLLNYSK